LIAILLLLFIIAPAQAQHNHSAGHSDYLNWASRKISNCCDNRDCGALKEGEVRETSSGPEVKIAGQWCPVLREHYIIKGKSPDWSVAHACIGNSSYHETLPPCERLLCYSAPGGF
jgi:hypothetical protein